MPVRTRELPSDRPTDALEQLRGELERVLQDTLRLNPYPRIGPSDEIDFYTEVERYEKALSKTGRRNSCILAQAP
jgi:hypothetical protein